MDILDSARQLGKDIQADERYKACIKAQEAATNDAKISEMAKRLDEIQAEFEKIATEHPENEEKMELLHSEYIELFQKANAEPAMAALLDARAEMDKMMTDIMAIIFLCINGEDPDTCKPTPETYERMQNSVLGI